MSSPYLCVCGDDHVTRYMGADVDVGEHADAQRRSGDPICVCGDDHVTRYMGADVDAGEHADGQRRSGDHYVTVYKNSIMDFLL